MRNLLSFFKAPFTAFRHPPPHFARELFFFAPPILLGKKTAYPESRSRKLLSIPSPPIGRGRSVFAIPSSERKSRFPRCYFFRLTECSFPFRLWCCHQPMISTPFPDALGTALRHLRWFLRRLLGRFFSFPPLCDDSPPRPLSFLPPKGTLFLSSFFFYRY